MKTTATNTVTEDNVLIAEFMELNLYRCKWQKDTIATVKTIAKENELKYHTSWDWLMPVVDKCTQTGDDTSQWDDLADALTTINIKTVYEAVIDFIKWYNELK